MRKRIFILSPANAGGVRARLLLNPAAGFDLALRLRNGEAAIGDIFSFISGLYFRGKLAYSRHFANPPVAAPYAAVIAAGRGLLPPETLLSVQDIEAIAAVPVDLNENRYRETLERDTRALASAAGTECDIILLGSVATNKYLIPLLEIFGERLLFPSLFTGRGDMSRGALMLRSVRSSEELEYVPAITAPRWGIRPRRMGKIAEQQ